MRARVMALSVALFAGQAAAADLPFAPPSPMVDAMSAKPTRTAFARGFAIASWRGTFETTHLIDVQKRFGGTIARQGDAGTSEQWLCYDLPDSHQRLWLVSYEINGGTVAEVTMAEASAPAQSPQCPALTAGTKVNIDGFVGLGTPAMSLAGKLGKPGLEKADWAAWYRNVPAGKGCTEDETLAARSDHGHIAFVSAHRTTSC